VGISTNQVLKYEPKILNSYILINTNIDVENHISEYGVEYVEFLLTPND